MKGPNDSRRPARARWRAGSRAAKPQRLAVETRGAGVCMENEDFFKYYIHIYIHFVILSLLLGWLVFFLHFFPSVSLRLFAWCFLACFLRSM